MDRLVEMGMEKTQECDKEMLRDRKDRDEESVKVGVGEKKTMRK